MMTRSLELIVYIIVEIITKMEQQTPILLEIFTFSKPKFTQYLTNILH